MRRWWPLTARGTGAAIAAAVCFIIAHEAGLVELVYFGVLLCAAVAVSVVSLFLTRRTGAVTRTLSPDIAEVGRESAVRVRVGIRSALPTVPGRWEDTLPDALTGRAAGIFPAIASGLRGGDPTVEVRYTVEGARRGIHPLGPLWVTSTDPFGLARRRFRLGSRTDVTVAPAIVELPAMPPTVGAAGGMLQSAHARLGQGADNLVARPYASGDSMRRIHWRATAHRDTLMVRQEEQEASPEATVVFDRGALRWGPEAMSSPGADPAFETGVSLAVSAVMLLVREGYTVEVVDSDGRALCDPITSGEIFEVEALATQLATDTTRKGDDLAHVGALFAGILTGPVVVITGRIGTEDTVLLAPVAHHSALPMLLAVNAGSDPIDRLRGYGWHAVGLDPDADLAHAWASALERGAARVG